ncbi:thermonuclease family protein [Patescibacteria group bacterium]|nr:thermonuclease family protein [Patescibacteria group bacterium]
MKKPCIFLMSGLVVIMLGSIIWYVHSLVLESVSMDVQGLSAEAFVEEFDDEVRARLDNFFGRIAPAADTYDVVAVVDGDTIDVRMSGGVSRVRYIGMNTPEVVHPNRQADCFGIEARNKNATLVSGRRVRLEKDMSEIDAYGRLLRYVYVDGEFVNEALVAGGYAHASTYPPDVRYTQTLLAAERAAKADGKGLWGADCAPLEGDGLGLDATLPFPVDTVNACLIKGNVSVGSGDRLYYTVYCADYDETVITEANGELWFCTEAEAKLAGWRKAENCE